MHTPKTMQHRDTQNANLILWPVFWQGVTARRNRNSLPLWARLAPPWPVVAALGACTAIVIVLALS
jgi:hypothetical protein